MFSSYSVAYNAKLPNLIENVTRKEQYKINMCKKRKDYNKYNIYSSTFSVYTALWACIVDVNINVLG